MKSNICPICKKADQLRDIPDFLGSSYSKVCKSCCRELWQQFDSEQGIGDVIPRLKKDKSEPTKRHREIAKIARDLGAKVSSRDVQTVLKAVWIEYTSRSDNMANSDAV